MSAQCTDKRVNIITPQLFKKYKNTHELSLANLSDVENILKSCSFFRVKSKNIINMAIQVENEFSGEIPLKKEDLMKLPGVGNKTANVVLIEFKNENKMAVDTHVFRVSHRLGLSKSKNVGDTEKDLVAKFKTDLAVLHQAMVLFGRYTCKSVAPKCEECFLLHFCKTKNRFKPN